MSSFYVDLKKSKEIANEEGNIASELATISTNISKIKSAINLDKSTPYIRNRILKAANKVEQEKSKMKEMQSKLEIINSKYESTENRIVNKKVKVTSSKSQCALWSDVLFSDLRQIAFNIPGTPQLTIDFATWLITGKIDEKYDSNINIKEIANVLDGYKGKDSSYVYKIASKIKDYNEKIDDFNKNNSEKKTAAKGYFDEDGKYHSSKGESKEAKENEKVRKEIDSLKEVATVYKRSAEISGSIASGKVAADNGIASGSISYDVGKASANASISAGVYSYDENGNKKFTPGAQIAIGVGVTALTTTATGRIGNDYLDVHGSVTATVGKADASGSVNVGLYDGDGNFNPQAKISAKAEAIAAELSGSVGTKVAGTDIGVTGSINVGIGAHADIGIKDGKISVDIGASVGLGVSVKLDLDFSGTVDAVSNIAKAIWPW